MPCKQPSNSVDGVFVVSQYSSVTISVNLGPVLGDGSDAESYVEGIYGQFLVGTPGTACQMADRLGEGRVAAHYSGTTLNFAGIFSFQMDVYFCQQTWHYYVKDGFDGNVYVSPDNNHLYGDIGWRASGDVVGATFVSTQVSADDGAVRGIVQGGDSNPDVSAVAGVADLGNYRTDETYTNAKHVVSFAAIEVPSP